MAAEVDYTIPLRSGNRIERVSSTRDVTGKCAERSLIIQTLIH